MPAIQSFPTTREAIEVAYRTQGLFKFEAPGFTICNDCFGLRAYADDRVQHLDEVAKALREWFDADIKDRSYGAEWKLGRVEPKLESISNCRDGVSQEAQIGGGIVMSSKIKRDDRVRIENSGSFDGRYGRVINVRTASNGVTLQVVVNVDGDDSCNWYFKPSELKVIEWPA